MSDFQPIPAPVVNSSPAATPPEPKKRPSWLIPAVAAVVAASIGYGAAGGAAAAPEPQVITETKEVEVIKEVEVPVEVVKETTPKACLEALDLAGAGLGIAAGLIGQIQPAAMAGLKQDVAAIEAITSDLRSSNAQLEQLTPKAAAASAECRAGAEPGA